VLSAETALLSVETQMLIQHLSLLLTIDFCAACLWHVKVC